MSGTAAQHGATPDHSADLMNASALLTVALPILINRLTPQGQVPSQPSLQSSLGGLLGGLLGGR
jgi:uncharacterized protein YidB (DUF937 family)